MVAPGKRVGVGAAGTPGRGRVLAAIAAVLVGGLVYVNALRNPFVYDDHRLILENTSLHHLSNLRAIALHDMTRPVVNLSYALDYAVWGERPFGFHLTNLLLHLLNVVLLFRLALATAADQSSGGPRPHGDRSTVVAAVAAMLFAVHPMMTESVGYVSGRSEVLCATFFLLAMLCGRRWLRGSGVRWGVLTIAFWILGLGVKEIAAMLPFVLASYALLLLPGGAAERRGKALTMLLPIAALAVAFVALRLSVLTLVEHPGDGPLSWRLGLVELDVMRRYLVLFIVPIGQAVYHAVSPIESLWTLRALVAVAVAALLLATTWRVRHASPLVSFGLLWFVLLLVPSSVLVMLDRGEPMAEHRTYLASCGLFLTAGSVAAWLRGATDIGRRAQLLTRLAGVAIVVWLGGHTILRNAVWGSPIGLWLEAAERAPDHWWPRLLLGQALHDAGRPAEAVAEFRSAIALRPEEPLGYAKLGESLTELGQFDEAAATLERLRARDPNSPVVFTALGAVAMVKGDSTRAKQYFQEALTKDPLNIPARQGLVHLLGTENPAEALRLCEEIFRLDSNAGSVDDCTRSNRAGVGTESHE